MDLLLASIASIGCLRPGCIRAEGNSFFPVAQALLSGWDMGKLNELFEQPRPDRVPVGCGP